MNHDLHQLCLNVIQLSYSALQPCMHVLSCIFMVYMNYLEMQAKHSHVRYMGLRGGSRGAGLQFGLATAQQELPPSLSAVMWMRHSSLWRQHNYSWMNTVSLRSHFCRWKMQLLISCAAFPLKKYVVFWYFHTLGQRRFLNMLMCYCLMDKFEPHFI